MATFNGINKRTPKSNASNGSRPHTVFGSQTINSIFGKSPNSQITRLEDLPEDGEPIYARKYSTSSVKEYTNGSLPELTFSNEQSNLAAKLNAMNYSLESLNSNASTTEDTMAKLTDKKRTESSSGIIKEGYVNKKSDLSTGYMASTLNRGWKLYYVTLVGAKLSFYKPPTESEVRNSIAFSTSSLGSNTPLSSSPSSVFSKSSRSPTSTGIPLIPATFDSASRTILFGSNNGSKPLSEKYIYGDIFTEVDVLNFKFKRYTCLLIFDEILMVFKRRWIKSNRGSIFSAVNEALKIGNSGALNEEMDPSKGSFTKWKHHATYNLKDCDVIDASSTVFNTSNSPNRNQMFTHVNSSASSISTLSPQGDYSAPLSSGKVQAFQLFIRDKIRTTRLFVAPNSESKLAWTSRLASSKELPGSEIIPLPSIDGDTSIEVGSALSKSDQTSLRSDALSLLDSTHNKTNLGLEPHPELIAKSDIEGISGLSKPVIESGSAEALIHEAVFASKTYKNGSNYREVFLYTYPLFTSSSTILQELKNYTKLLPSEECDFNDNHYEVRLRMGEFIGSWLSLSGTIIEHEILNDLKDFIENNLFAIESRFNLLGMHEKLLNQRENIEKTIKESPGVTEFSIEDSQTGLSSLVKTGLTPSVFLKMDPQELAQQLYAYHYQEIGLGASNLGDPRLVLGSLSGLNSTFSCSGSNLHFLTKLIYHHLFFATPSSAPSRRAAILNQWIQVGHMTRDLGDMASWIAISYAVCSPTVTRLSETWRSVDKRLIKLVTKRWIPVLIDLGLFAPKHPGSCKAPKCMILIQEPSAKRSPTKFIIPYFGAFQNYITSLLNKPQFKEDASETDKTLNFSKFQEVYDVAQALRGQWPYMLSLEAYKGSSLPFKIRKVYMDYFKNISSFKVKGQCSFTGEMSCDYSNESLHKRSMICEMSFVDDYVVSEKSPSKFSAATVALKLPKSLPTSPLFIDLISSYFPLNSSNIGIDNAGLSVNSTSESGIFRKRTQSVPVSAYSTTSSRESTRKVNSSQFESFDNRIQVSKMSSMLRENLLLVKRRTLLFFRVQKDNEKDPLDDITQGIPCDNLSNNIIEVQVCSGSIEDLVEVLIYGVEQFSQSLLDHKEIPIPGLTNKLVFNKEDFREIFFCTYRSITQPKRLFEVLKESFNRSLSKLMTLSKPTEQLIKDSIQEQNQILEVFHFWLSYHFHDFLDSPDLLDLVYIFLYSLSEKMGSILDKSVSSFASELHNLCEIRALTPIVSSGNKSKEERTEPAFKTPYAQLSSPSASSENLLAAVPSQVSSWDIDTYSESQLLDAFHHFVIPMLKKATPKDYFLSCSLLEAQSVSTWSWLSSSKPLSYSEDETVISDIFSLLENCRRRCTIINSSSSSGPVQNQSANASTSLTCDRVLVSLFPRPIADLWQFRDKIRTWAIQQISGDIEYEVRIERIFKLLRMICICRKKMRSLASTHYKLLSDLMNIPDEAVSQLQSVHQIPSFVERGLLSGLISPEGRCFTRAWNEVASKLGVPIDDFCSLVNAVENSFDDELPTIEAVAPCVGYVFESTASIIRSLPDHSSSSVSIHNISKRTVIYKLLQAFTEWVGLATVNQPNRRGFDTMKLLSGLEVLKKPDWVKVKQISTTENGNTNNSYATSIYYYATGTGSFRRVFGTLVSEQLEKQKLENRERERVMREVKAHQIEMLKKQQEQAKLHDKQQKELQVRRAKNKELIKMASLYKTVQSNGDTSLSLSQFSSITSRKPVEVIKLINSTTEVDEAYTKRDFVLRIITEEGGQYLIQCLDEADMYEWRDLISQAARQAAARRVTLLAQDMKSLSDVDNSASIVTEKSKNSVFGVDLSKVMQGLEVPLVVRKCINEVERRGLEEIGIYRVPGSASRINALCRAFDKDSESVDLEHEDWQDINVIACTLKQYLRDLPEPIATFELYDSFIKAVTIEDYDERLFAIKDLLPKLPEKNYTFLKVLIEHLERVTDYEEINHMYATNLAIVFGPTIFRPPPSDASFALSMANLGHQQNLVKNLILQYHWLFDVEAEVEVEEEHSGLEILTKSSNTNPISQEALTV